MKFIFILLALFAIIGLILGIPTFAKADLPLEPDGLPDIGLPRNTYWEVVWRNNGDSSDKFHLRYKGAVGAGFCDITIAAHCKDGPGVAPPPVGFKCLLEGTQAWTCGKYQGVQYDEHVSQECWAYSAITENESCCDTCQACFYKINKDGSRKSLGCLPYTNITNNKLKPYYLATVRLTSPEKVEMITNCTDDVCKDMKVYINNKLWNTSAFADCQGTFGCGDIGFTTTEVPVLYVYNDRGCDCAVGVKAIDP